MPGKKARKNAQPSPARAPAGRDQLGRRSWPGRGGRDGVEVSIGAGSARLLGASGSGLVCALAHAFGAWKSFGGFLSRIVETAREGPRFGMGMQRHFSGGRKPLRPPSTRTCPALATGKKSAKAGASRREKIIVTPGGDGRSSWHYLASRRFPRQASFSGSPGPWRALRWALSHSPPATQTKAEITLGLIPALPPRTHGGLWKFHRSHGVQEPRNSCFFVESCSITILISCGKGVGEPKLVHNPSIPLPTSQIAHQLTFQNRPSPPTPIINLIKQG